MRCRERGAGESMEVRELSESELTAEMDRQILELQQLAFPQTVEFKTQRWWHTPARPEDRWFLVFEGPRLIGSVRVVHRTIATSGGPRLIGGVANVCSHPEARGSGAAKAAMRATAAYIGRSADFGLLGCGTKVHGFYAGLGWADMTDTVSMIHADGHHGPVAANPEHYNMIYPGRCGLDQWPAGPIDLNGQDW
jgi:hypothetical protein